MMENERIRRILEMMERQQIDLLLLMPSAGMKYALGDSPIADERLFVLALAPGKKPFLLANSLYQLEAAELFDGECVFWQDGEDPYPVLRRQLEVLGYRWNRTAVERSTQAQFLLPLQKLLPGAGFEPASEILDRLRIHKDEEERDRLRKASRLGDEALRRVMERGGRWIGKTEAEFFARLSYEMTCLGLDVPDASVGIILSSTSTQRQRIQRLGRIIRKNEEKDKASLYYLHVQETSEDACYLPGGGENRILELEYLPQTGEFYNESYERAAGRFLEEVKNKFSDNLYAVGQWLRALAIWLIGSLPILLPAAFAIIAALLLLRKWNKRKKRRLAENPSTSSGYQSIYQSQKTKQEADPQTQEETKPTDETEHH